LGIPCKFREDVLDTTEPPEEYSAPWTKVQRPVQRCLGCCCLSVEARDDGGSRRSARSRSTSGGRCFDTIRMC
jgi:hypothetical protein